jgi:hypothetical protein
MINFFCAHYFLYLFSAFSKKKQMPHQIKPNLYENIHSLMEGSSCLRVQKNRFHNLVKDVIRHCPQQIEDSRSFFLPG